MRYEDLGIDKKNGYMHDKRLTPAESRFLGLLWVDHVGKGACVPAEILAVRYFTGCAHDDAIHQIKYTLAAGDVDDWKRDIRYLQNHLLEMHDKIPVYSVSGSNGGYFIGETDAEGAEFYGAFQKRGMTGLKKAARGKQAALVDMVEQLSFEFDELDDRTGMGPAPRHAANTQTPIAIVDAMLGRMLADPERFSDGLRRIGRKYGSVLLPKAAIADMQAKAQELARMVAGLG